MEEYSENQQRESISYRIFLIAHYVYFTEWSMKRILRLQKHDIRKKLNTRTMKKIGMGGIKKMRTETVVWKMKSDRISISGKA